MMLERGEIKCPRCLGSGKLGVKEACMHRLRAALEVLSSADIDAVAALAETMMRKYDPPPVDGDGAIHE